MIKKFELRSAVAKIAIDCGCDHCQAKEISLAVDILITASGLGVTPEQFMSVKKMNSLGSRAKEIFDATGVPIHKIYRITKD